MQEKFTLIIESLYSLNNIKKEIIKTSTEEKMFIIPFDDEDYDDYSNRDSDEFISEIFVGINQESIDLVKNKTTESVDREISSVAIVNLPQGTKELIESDNIFEIILNHYLLTAILENDFDFKEFLSNIEDNTFYSKDEAKEIYTNYSSYFSKLKELSNDEAILEKTTNVLSFYEYID